MQFYFIFPSFLSFLQYGKLYVHNATKETKTNYKNGARLGMMGVGAGGGGERIPCDRSLSIIFITERA
jgi:hypothetical protein